MATVTGSPRFDICAPSFAWLTDAESRNAALVYQPYILVCSRFSNTVHAKGPERPFEIFLDLRDRPKGFDMRLLADQVFEQWRHELHDFAEFVVLIKELAAAFPLYTVVVRPHPGESMRFFEQAFAMFPNVVVRRDGNVLAWIRPAALVVHSNCTTGVEAVLAGRPVVNFKPEGNDRSQVDVEVACEAGVAVGTIPAALSEAQRLLSGGVMTISWSREAEAMLNNLKADAIPLLAKATMEILRERHIDASKIVLPKVKTLRKALRPLIRHKRLEPYVAALRLLVQRKHPDSYVASKRGRLNPEHVEMVLHESGAHGLGGGRVRHLTDEYAVIEPA
jgi:hypothetical protein